jgi:hypothetical protein
MKRAFVFIITVILLIALFGCSRQASYVKGGIDKVNKSDYSIEDISDFFSMKKADIIKMLGSNYEEGTLAIDECTVPINALMYHDKLTFFGLQEDDSEPTRIECADTVEIAGLRNGMTFDSIQKLLGNTTVIKTWISNQDNIAYRLDYDLGKVKVSILSNDEVGKSSYLVFYKY